MTKYFSLLILAACLLGLSACEENQSTQSPEVFQMGNGNGGGGTTPANPQIVRVSSKVVSKNTYYTVAVMDTDGSHLTHVYTAPYLSSTTSTNSLLGSTSWSPDGNSVSFVEQTRSGSTVTACQLKRMNVSLVNGVPTGSSVSSLYSNTNLAISSASWCALSSTNLIAFVVNENTGGGSAVGKLYTV